MNLLLSFPRKSRSWLAIPIGILAAIPVVYGLSIFLPEGIDWHLFFRPAALAVMEGHSPYTIEGFYNAPWVILFILPFAPLPEPVGRAAFFLVGLIAYALIAHRLGAKPLAVGAFIISPPVMHGLLFANIDWLAMLGFILPPQVGLFFLAIKPQVGLGVAIFILVDSWLHGGIREVVRVFWPITLALLLSFVLFGPWPLRFEEMVNPEWNTSMWPMLIPVGLTLLVAAIRRRKIEFAMGAGPCLSPYLAFHTWAAALVSLSKSQWEMVAAVAGLWVLVILRAIGV